MTPTTALETRLAELTTEAEELERKSSRISGLRGVSFLGAAGGALFGLVKGLPAAGWVGVGAAAACFVGLVIAHAVLISRASEKTERAAVVRRWLDRIAGKHHDFPETGERFLEPGHGYARDLDVFGKASIFQLLSDARTPAGERRIADWLNSPAPPDEIAARQAAARELAPKTRFREDLAVLGRRAAAANDARAPRRDGDRPDPLLVWAGAKDDVEPPRWLLVGAGVLLATTLALFVASEVVPAERLGPMARAWLVSLGLHVVVLATARHAIEGTVGVVASREAPFGRYRPLFARLEDETLKAPRAARVVATLRGASGHDASNEMRALDRLTGLAELRHSTIVYLLVNLLTMWDLWCAFALARWRRRAGGRVFAWIEAVGEMEALASLAALSYERPAFCWPEVREGEARFEADALGHPLLPEDRRVDNDVRIERPGTALLVTGSNMSGKSTLLRSMGLAAVLSQAGAPVCAARLCMSPLTVRTSMRVDDSLERGVSHFYAELERLKTVVDGARTGAPLFFLLDEILHGTNSRERHLGATAVVTHLLDRGAIGAVSSHDLELVDLERASGGRVTLVHFEELVEDGKMTFDYKLKPGVVTTTNALRLMRMVGLPV